MTHGVSLKRLQEILDEVRDQFNQIDDFCNTSKSYSEKYFYAKGKLEAVAHLMLLLLANDDEIV